MEYICTLFRLRRPGQQYLPTHRPDYPLENYCNELSYYVPGISINKNNYSESKRSMLEKLVVDKLCNLDTVKI
jgi:hypothetical protein